MCAWLRESRCIVCYSASLNVCMAGARVGVAIAHDDTARVASHLLYHVLPHVYLTQAVTKVLTRQKEKGEGIDALPRDTSLCQPGINYQLVSLFSVYI